MNDKGDGISVKYDPDLASARRERDNLRVELSKREQREKELARRVRKLERRLTDVASEDEKIAHLKQQLAKKEKHIDGLQKYLKKLPTLDEFSQCAADKNALRDENEVLAKKFSEIKEQLGPYIQKVKSMKRKNTELDEELKRLIAKNSSLEDKLCCKGADSEKENRHETAIKCEIDEQKASIESALLQRLRTEREERINDQQRFHDEIEAQSNSIATLMAEVKQKMTDLDASQSELAKFKTLHQELQKEVQMLTGEFGPDKLREEFQVAVEEFQTVVDLTRESDEFDIDEMHQTCRLGADKSLPELMEQLHDIRQTVLDLHANIASEKCQIQ